MVPRVGGGPARERRARTSLSRRSRGSVGAVVKVRGSSMRCTRRLLLEQWMAPHLESIDLAGPVVAIRLADDRRPREAFGILALHGKDGLDNAAKEGVG